MRKHKETFFQPADGGVPSHWVVQYYDEDSAFTMADYFSTEDAARELEAELIKEVNND